MITWRELLVILQFLEKTDPDKMSSGAAFEIDCQLWILLPKNMRFRGASEDRLSPIQCKLMEEIVHSVNKGGAR